MVQIKDIKPKISSAKKNITIKGALADELKFVDETGDITSVVLDAIPEGTETVTVKISIDLDGTDE